MITITTTTLNAVENNIYNLGGNDTTYSTARSVYNYTNSVDTSYVGQTTGYYVDRSILQFDLSSIVGTITEAIVKFKGADDSSTTDFNIQCRAYTESSLASDTTSFNAYGSTSFGSINTSNYSSDTDGMTITLNESGLAYLNSKRGGTCYLMLVSDEDMNESVPTGNEYIAFHSAEAFFGGWEPHLTLTYTEVTWKPQIRFF